MKTKILIRIAAGCLLFFAMGHSIGHFTRHNVTEPKAKEILQRMIDNKFDMFGQMRSYDENYNGMSLNLIFTLIAFTILLWILFSDANNHYKSVKYLLIPIAICILGFSVTSFLYFFPMPAIACLIASILLIISIVKPDEIRNKNTSR